jgi:hypothetical protein
VPLRLHVLPEDGLDRLLARGELGGDVHQLARPGGSLATQLAHQVAARGAGEERADDIRVGDVGQLGALLRKLPDVVPERLPRLLTAASEILGVPRAHVRALEVAGEGLDQVVPVGDLPRRQMLQCSIPKIQILKFSQTPSKFKMNFKFHFKMFVCEMISTNKI